MNHHSFKEIVIDIAIIFLLSLTPLLWFRQGALFLGHDNTFPLDPQIFLNNRLSTWTENFFGHDQSLILGTIPIHFIDAIPSFFSISLEAGQQIIYVFWFFTIGLSAYILAHSLRPGSRLFRFTAVILYQFNYFILQGWWIGEKSKFSAYIAMPLVLAVILGVTRSKVSVAKGTVLTALILFVFNAGGLYGIPLFGGALIAIGTLLFLKAAAYWLARDYPALGRLALFGIVALTLTILANAYFLIPAYAKMRSREAPGIETVGGVSGIISWAAEISANTSFLNLMRLEGIPEWYDNPQHPYARYILEQPIFIAVSYIWPLLVLASLLVGKKTGNGRMTTFFFIVYLLGIFFAAGTHPPLGFIYQFFVEKIPGFVIFRTPYYKFAPAIFLATAFLTAYLVDSFSARSRKLVFTALVAIVFAYHYPYFTGNFFAWRDIFSTRLTIPSYVYEFGTWLNKEKSGHGRVLLLPPNSPDLLYSAYNWGYLSFQSLPTLMSGRPVVINNDQVTSLERTLLASLYRAISERDEHIIKKIASMLDISYVVLQRDVISDPRSTIPIETAAFARAVENNNQFVFVRSFGQWDVYTLRTTPLSKFYNTDRLLSLHGNVKELDPYYSFLGETNTFVDRTDEKRLQLAPQSVNFVIPTCLTCPFKNRPEIFFPERNILPDDPFYQVVLFLEGRRSVPKDSKAAIYHFLGISLKRVSEINEMLFRQKALTREMVDQYLTLLRSVEENFADLPSLQEKIEVAQDVRDYLRAERNFLRPNLNKNVPAGGQTVLVGNIFSEISRLEKHFELPELSLDETTNRVYQFSPSQEGEFELLLRTEEFRQIAKEGSEISAHIDNTVPRTLRITREMLERSWFSFGRLRLGPGFHTLILSFPRPPGSIQTLSAVETEFSAPGENVCYGARVANIVSQKLYKLTVSYLNDFSDNLLLFIWDEDRNTRKLKNAVKLVVSNLPEKNEQIIEAAGGTREVLIAFCAPNLTTERAEKQFQVKVSEVLYPLLLLHPQEVPTQVVEPAEFEQISATRYRVTGKVGTSMPQVLVFSERYDDWWELQGVEAKHVRANGYANAWVIDGHPSEDVLEVRYRGEQYFFYGKIVSMITVLGGVAYLMWRIARRKYYG